MLHNNMPTLAALTPAPNDPSRPLLEDGDVALILKKDGTYRIASVGVDEAAMADPAKLANPSLFTEDELGQLERGQMVMALTLPLINPQLMSILTDMLADPDIIDPVKLAGVAKH